MKLFITTLIICFSIFAANRGFAEEASVCRQSEEVVKTATYGHLDAKALKTLIDMNIPHVLLDARGEQWHDGNVLPGARLAWYQFTQEEFDQIIPSHDCLVIVYCGNYNCPLSRWLAERLVKLGYQNVLEYPGGIKEWRDIANYPVEIIK